MKKIILPILLCSALLLLFGLGGRTPETAKVEEIGQSQNTTSSDVKKIAGAENVDEAAAKANEEIPKSKYYFTNGNALKVKDKSSQGKDIDTLTINTRVEVLEEEVVGIKNIMTMAYIQYKTDKEGTLAHGWIPKTRLNDNQVGNFPEGWEELDFTPVPKKNYTSNPRVEVKGIYVSANSIASTRALERLLNIANKTEINTFVIDVKDDFGNLLWDMTEISEEHGVPQKRKPLVKDIQALMTKLKENNIHLIARVVSFKDPTYAAAKPDRVIIDNRNELPFTNADGLLWVSAYDRELWNYNIAVSKEAAKMGFNEVQFDYVRFPASAGGKLDEFLDYRNTKNEVKPVAIQKYLKQAYEELSAMEVYTSADVYGQVASSPDDMALGQYWEAVSNYVDYISPMVYPSHYANGVYQTKIADAEPYRVVKSASKDAAIRNNNIETPAIVRTWIQDFTAAWVRKHIKYGVKEVREQIRGLNDAGYTEYILWNSSNRYSFEKEI